VDNLIRVLRSFSEGKEDKEFVDKLIDLLKDKLINNVHQMYIQGLKFDNSRTIFPEQWKIIYSGLKEIDFFKYFIPLEYGGKKITEENLYFIMELLGYVCPSLGIIFVAHSRAIDLILAGNDESQKSRFLEILSEGNFGAIAMTEEGAGSDPTAIELSAKPEGDYYAFHGEKTFVSNAGLATIYTVLANTKGKRGARSLSAFIVESNTDGFLIENLPEKDGLKILPTGRLIFNNSLIPKQNLVGKDGGGLLLVLDVIDKGRILLAGVSCGLASRIFDEVFNYSRKRIQFDRPLTSSQDISFKMSDMVTQINGARALSFHALKQINTQHYRNASSQAKLFASQMVMSVADLGLKIMGGRGYFKNSMINMLSADARGMEYLEGTSSIQKMIISTELFKNYD